MAEKEAVERRLQARRAAEEVRREVMGRLCQGGWGVRGRSVGGRRTERQGRGRRMGKGRKWCRCEGLRRAERREATSRGLLCADLKARRVANAFERTDRAMDFFL